jgi:hypothetical protein
MDLLVLADPTGAVDMTPEAIARRTNVPIEIVLSALSALSAPDPRSRSTESQGKRITPLDDHRDWGWQIVNFQAYHKIKDESARRENNRRYQQNHRKRKAHPSAPVSIRQRKSAPSAHIDVDVDVDVDQDKDKDLNNTHPPDKPAKARAKTKPVHDPDFTAFWMAYPKHAGGMKAAETAWNKAQDRPDIKIILQAIRDQSASDQWTKDNGQFIPHPTTWINQGRWTDELKRLRIGHDQDDLRAEESINRSIM